MKHKLIRDSARHFAETELAPIAAEIDKNATFPVAVIEKMKKLNYFGLQVPKEYGGAALDSISSAIVVEEISRVCAAVGLCITVHNGVAVYPVLLGTGKRFFAEGTPPRSFELAGTQAFPSGIVFTTNPNNVSVGEMIIEASYGLGEAVVSGAHSFNEVLPLMLARYCGPGLLGLGVTALIAGFMSGMAGNVTAFNTVWTYDIYQSYVKKDASDAHLLWVGRMTTVFGILASVGTAYLATRFNNIMDFLQLVFAFVNAPLFATFLLGMFWKRATGHGAFFGLVSGTLAAALHHGLTLPVGAPVGIKGGWLAATPLHSYPSEMAQNFWTAIWAWTVCFVATIAISYLTKRTKTDEDLTGLVYSLTPRPKEEHLPWWKTPEGFGVAVLVLAVVLNVLFW